ncbi:MAG TPA: hypothetical protein VHN14_06835 [Kofleriaceae bacterium]|nr:hypothetical protein [Kofleriaceae bacterium]
MPAPKVEKPHRPRYRVILWGPGDEADAVMQAARADPRFEVIAVASREELLTAEADCVVVATDPMTPSIDLDAVVLGLLESGKNVVSIAADTLPAARLREACQRGGASIHRIGCLATLMISRMVMTMVQGLCAVRHIRIVEALDLLSTPERRSAAWALGFGRDAAGFDDDSRDSPPAGSGNLAHVIAMVARDLYAAAATNVRIERTWRRIPAERGFAIEGGPVIEAGTVAAICAIHRGYVDDRLFFTSEEWRYLGPDHAYRGDDLPYGGFRGPVSYAIQIQADPADLESQWDLERSGPVDLVSGSYARMILDAIGPVCEAEPGVLLEDPSPRYSTTNLSIITRRT